MAGPSRNTEESFLFKDYYITDLTSFNVITNYFSMSDCFALIAFGLTIHGCFFSQFVTFCYRVNCF